MQYNEALAYLPVCLFDFILTCGLLDAQEL